ncbi:fasciclin-like arabinogalactan protein 6 [Quercus suber]|uniref:Fasciclin-like arabinogalactan protein 6 n=1 Tax=Quercus suber TaxID=58331 RepID=A0AAW0KAZ2_QUESU
MASTTLSLILIILNIQLLLLLLSPQTQAQTSAPAPSPSGPLNLTAILEKNGQYSTLIRLLQETQTDTQIPNQLNNSAQGLSFFAPTDNAFNNLPSGALNGLKTRTNLTDLLTVINPVPTQASGTNGNWGLNFTGQGNQVNVSTGIDSTQINNALRQQPPLAVYQVDKLKVLLPEELFGAKSPASAPPQAKAPSSSSNNSTNTSAPFPATSAGGRNVSLLNKAKGEARIDQGVGTELQSESKASNTIGRG